MPARPSRSRLLDSQVRRTSPADSSSVPPNPCGGRRTNFSCTPRAMSSNPSWPFSDRRRARKYTWNSRSPSSSASFASSRPIAASATSYASSTVCGTIVRSVCSRSHGQSRRSRSVSDWSSTSASARLKLLRSGGRARDRRAGIRVRLVADLVLDLPVAVALLRVVEPLRDLVVLLLLLELLPDRRAHLRKRRRRRRLHAGGRLDDVVAVLGVHRLRDLAGLQAERRLVERRHRLALRHRQLSAVRGRSRVLGVLLRELREVPAALQLLVETVGERLLRDEDVADIAALRLHVLALVRVVVGLDVGVRDLHVARDLLEERL